MTRFAIDADVAWRLIRDDRPVAASVSLVGAAALKSQALDRLYRLVRAEELSTRQTRDLLNRLAELKIALLGDRVTRENGVKLAQQLGWTELGPAETLALALLRADAIVTTDPQLIAAAQGRIRLADYSELVD